MKREMDKKIFCVDCGQEIRWTISTRCGACLVKKMDQERIGSKR